LETIEEKLLEKYQHERIFCFDDNLGQENSVQRNDLYTQLINESKNTSQSKCVYADFSYCSRHLLQMKIISSKDIQEQQKGLSTSTELNTNCLDETKSSTVNFINVLLLGESGVGKSTFINALANYLTFDTLEQARSGQPIVLMPVSFLITEGDDFKERILTFGDKDPNEDHNQSGQSVTQHCRSYVFTIDNQTKIRLIDTPGMGDTRGLDQDDLNMQHILSFINNLSHLNALCILLKPNEARLNVVLRSYFTRLVGFLGEHVCNNVIFCFTSTRTTFFAPGNTGPLLKKMLRSQPIKDIPFGKKNTFCFDNESFRYLIALLQGIKFDDYQKEEYLRSWVTSVNESNRLLDYMYDKLKPYPQNKWQSIEHAQFQITLLIRPMLETLRNLFRNVILQKHQPSQLPIELFPTPLSEPSTICLKCQFATQCCSNFLVVPDKLHIFSDKCKNCECSRRHHINVEYKLDYRNADIPNKEYWEKVKSDLDQLKKMILELTYFFTSIVPHSENDDPITKVLTQMIAEENRICSSENMKYLNPKLSDRLRRFNEEYKQKRNDSISNGNSIDLSAIYQLIEKISGMDSIKKQIDVIKEFRQEYMKNQEKEIHNDIRSKRH
jgi:GTP-binding protein EngB required for normal cell division